MDRIAKRVGQGGFAVLTALAFAGAAHAQTPQPKPATHAAPDAAGGTVAHGIIKPPQGVDPGIHATPPETGTMPVIPPPGTPGGKGNVVPK